MQPPVIDARLLLAGMAMQAVMAAELADTPANVDSDTFEMASRSWRGRERPTTQRRRRLGAHRERRLPPDRN